MTKGILLKTGHRVPAFLFNITGGLFSLKTYLAFILSDYSMRQTGSLFILLTESCFYLKGQLYKVNNMFISPAGLSV